MSKSRAPLAIGLAAAAGIGYYLYSAGGSPRAAEKKFEGDANHVAGKIKGETPHRSNDVEEHGRKVGQEIGSKVDDAVATVNRDLSKAKNETESYAKAAKADTLKKIDEFDRKVEEGTSKSKGYFSSWFGGK
ncbi:f04ab491-2dc2-4917-aa37-30954a3ee78c [Thermothielavioides terrestris]|uniref:Calcofluor white hypersensitive protein n=2 Tax=Thermothielavioides terrestris TaxID=2587410 RepID=G2QWQ4_THETT|nr:uncharacterized protein THITE_2106241 [Thermothielavioides terrestris NRRL 8126]AEO62264.1 hypothetical protein THITE_2106241 [Thermothielavioides terrestris NRRL 8126]SPQ22267.1 f04ab491-2dc2-4917-aa37-30954a3ee78c [Thermothielavioides terrestris]